MSEPTPGSTPLADLLGFTPTVQAQVPPTRGLRGVARALRQFVTLSVAAGAIVAASVTPFVATSGVAASQAADAWVDLPSRLSDEPLPQRSSILAADGTKIATFFAENRVLVPLAEVPAHVQEAFLAIEDARFYRHHGIDLKGTARALANNTGGGATQGGSTITQQYVKNRLLLDAETQDEKAAVTSQTSYARKVRELRYALALEKSTPKAKILEGYLNVAYFGDGA